MGEEAYKQVQTELAEDEYEVFRDFARKHGMTIKEAVHEAIVDWVEIQGRTDPADRAFSALDGLENESLPASAETDAGQEDDLVEEWTGDDVEFALDEDAAERK